MKNHLQYVLDSGVALRRLPRPVEGEDEGTVVEVVVQGEGVGGPCPADVAPQGALKIIKAKYNRNAEFQRTSCNFQPL